MYPNNLTVFAMLGDTPEPKRSEWSSKFTKFAFGNVMTPTTAKPGWLSVPSTYIFTTEDEPLPLNFQEALVKVAQESSHPEKGDLVPFSDSLLGQFTIETPHDAQLTHPKEVGEILVKIMGHLKASS